MEGTRARRKFGHEGTRARQHRWHEGTPKIWARGHEGTRARGHANIEGTRARRKFGHEGTRARGHANIEGTRARRARRARHLTDFHLCLHKITGIQNELRILTVDCTKTAGESLKVFPSKLIKDLVNNIN